MTIQELKARINGFFQPKTESEKARLRKYVIVFPIAVVCFIAICQITYNSLAPHHEQLGNVFKTDVPVGEANEMKTKGEEYAAADAAMKKESHQLPVDLQPMDSISSGEVLDSLPSAIEQSVTQYQEIQNSLDNFYVPDYNESSQVAELQARIAELETENANATPHVNDIDEVELMEKSYQLAAKYMGGNHSGPEPAQKSPEKGKRNVTPVTQTTKNVVSSLSASSSRSFNTSVGNERMTRRNTISAVVASNQTVTNGQKVKFRLTDPMSLGDVTIPKNTIVVGEVRLQGERLEIEITTIESNGCLFEVALQVFDTDGQAGINIPNSMESDAIHEVGANMGSIMGSSVNLSTNAGAAIVSDVGRGLINGVSQYLNKKLRTVKVHIKAGYRVILHQPDDV